VVVLSGKVKPIASIFYVSARKSELLYFSQTILYKACIMVVYPVFHLEEYIFYFPE